MDNHKRTFIGANHFMQAISENNGSDDQKRLCKEAILNCDSDHLKDVLQSVYAIDIAYALEDFMDEEIMELYGKLDDEHMAFILEQAHEEIQKRLVIILGLPNLLNIFNHMSKDDMADIVGNMPIGIRKDILKMMKTHDTKEIENLLLYHEETAGGLMTTEYIALSIHFTVTEALGAIKAIAPKTEVIELIFVVNKDNELVGSVDLRDILTFPDHTLLSEITEYNMITVAPEMDQEEVSFLVSKYDLKAIPVVNRKNSLLGIITVDDIIDVMVEEQTEDILKMGGVHVDESATNTLGKSIKMRLPWLCLNLITAFIASFTVSAFEGTIAQVTALAAAMPIIAGMGGNAGNQTLSLIIRSITLGEISLRKDWKLVFKETGVGLFNGLCVGLVAGIVLMIQYQNIYLGFIVLMATTCNLVVAGISGFLIPLILKSLKVDPALASSIFLTTITDVFGFFIFLSLANGFLPFLI